MKKVLALLFFVASLFSSLSVAANTNVYRLYNNGLKYHLFTKDLNEYQTLGQRGWKQEGIAWKFEETGKPVYRMYHSKLRVHLYTTDTNEYKVLGQRGWKQEGISFYSTGTVPVYRMYHSKLRVHLYTVDTNEYKVLGQRGWKQEGVAFYSLPKNYVENISVDGKSLSGYSRVYKKEIKLREVADFGTTMFQSFYFDNGNVNLLHNEEQNILVFRNGKNIGRINKPYTGHNNDVDKIGKELYIAPGGLKLNVFNLTTSNLRTISLKDVERYGQVNNTRIDVGGISQSTKNPSLLYLVALDKRSNSQKELVSGTDVLVFEHDLKTGRQRLSLRLPLTYIGLLQGVVELNGYLYIIQNAQTTNDNLSNYTGISIKVMDMTRKTYVDEILIKGSFEAEGADIYVNSVGNKEIAIGLHQKGKVEKIISFTPYK